MIKITLFIMVTIFNLGFAQTLRVGIGLAKPPFIMEDLNSGIELDIIKSVFKEAKIEIVFESFPQARVYQSFLSGKIDVIITVKDLPDENSFMSDPYTTFENIILFKAKNNFNIQRISDLKSYSIGGFQNASSYLGNEFTDTVKLNRRYHEFALQKEQVKMLIADRLDVIVLEKNIAFYYLKNFGQKKSEYKLIHLFPKNNYKVAFRDKNLRDKFNASLLKFKHTSKEKLILNKYIFN